VRRLAGTGLTVRGTKKVERSAVVGEREKSNANPEKKGLRKSTKERRRCSDCCQKRREDAGGEVVSIPLYQKNAPLKKAKELRLVSKRKKMGESGEDCQHGNTSLKRRQKNPLDSAQDRQKKEKKKS